MRERVANFRQEGAALGACLQSGSGAFGESIVCCRYFGGRLFCVDRLDFFDGLIRLHSFNLFALGVACSGWDSRHPFLFPSGHLTFEPLPLTGDCPLSAFALSGQQAVISSGLFGCPGESSIGCPQGLTSDSDFMHISHA